MKLDFDQLKRLSDSFHAQYTADGDLFEQLDKGCMVYSINFDPSVSRANVHVQWPYFRNLVANGADHPATYSVVQQTPEAELWIHWSCSVQGVEITACLSRADMVKTLRETQEIDFHWTDEDTVVDLLVLWMNMTGWNGGAMNA